MRAPVPALRLLALAAMLLLAGLQAAPPACAQMKGQAADRPEAKAPREIAGLRLGADIKEFGSRVSPGTPEVDAAVRYLSTVAVEVPEGFRSGYVTYGNCEQPGRVVRVKMNYADDSRAFYEKILTLLKQRYGEPAQWRGNPFGSLRIWKWSLTDPELGDISLILQYYSGDDDTFTKGNSIRLSAPGLIARNRDCWAAAHPDGKGAQHRGGRLKDMEAGMPH
ncbi:hypothetical protein [Fundidesulfovibrio agrisoli]|uniref:hypothetical protein n=1 Tax=Fundidesulfovibrio agrisoli TaxID=2922717 RepID=UPI001FAD3758|nr:hypothetical protein [Fundidesulfovibrio agrisoli]